MNECSLVENTCWRNVVQSWAEYTYVQEFVEASDLLSQPLWNNVFIKIENTGKLVFYKTWYLKNLCYVNDLVDEFGIFVTNRID